MKGLRIIRNGDCLEEVSKNNTKVKLLARAGEMEVMLQTIKADQHLTIKNWSGSELFYILDGVRLYHRRRGDGARAWDYLQATQLVQPAYFGRSTS